MEWVRDTTSDLWHIMHNREKKCQGAPERWSPPAPGWIKCNVDGAFYIQESSGATGAVLRDHSGAFLQARAVWRDHAPDALTMEVLAFKEGQIMARSIGARKIVAETDCAEVVHLWNALNTQTISLILADIKDLSRSFDEFSLFYLNRSCNRLLMSVRSRFQRSVEWRSGM
jgi:ribonuclease HI